jgi:hypothetical protein
LIRLDGSDSGAFPFNNSENRSSRITIIFAISKLVRDLGFGVKDRGYRWWSGIEGRGWGSQIEWREEIRVVSADLKAAEEVVV